MTEPRLDLDKSVVLAPMAGITDPTFRRLVQEFGISALWTEMINAQGFLNFPERFHTIALNGRQVPTFFQIFGAEPNTMALAAKALQDRGASGIDINMGCPVKKVVKKGAGAFLMKTPAIAAAIVAKVRKQISVPLSVKIRSGWDETSNNAPEFAKILESEGADLIVVHCRSRSQLHSGAPRPEIIAEVKAKVSAPVIGNGGVTTIELAEKMFKQTGCNGVMIGRGALGRPWFPAEIIRSIGQKLLPAKGPVFLDQVVKRHFELHRENGQNGPGLVRYMRKHLVWYSRGGKYSSEFRRKVMETEDMGMTIEMVERFLGGISVS